MQFCGLDFGTSNSAISIAQGNAIALAAVDGDQTTTPSAMFFPSEGGGPVYGREAIGRYIDGDGGRLLRGLKSILGTNLIDEKTRVGSRQVSFADLIGAFVGTLKASAERSLGRELDSVVMGRPVHFVGTNSDSDEKAEAALIQLARDQGFSHVEMQFEPIAAALHYESLIDREELALIADIGGGTSDFSVVRVSPDRARAVDRRGDILGNSGVRLGGTDLDQRLNLATAMGLLGYGAKVRAEFGDKITVAPQSIFFELSIWHRIIFAYTQKNLTIARELRWLALDRAPFERLLVVLDERLAHRISETVETAKIALSSQSTTELGLDYVEAGLSCAATTALFEDAIEAKVAEISEAARSVVQVAGLKTTDITNIFFTGGSSHIPRVRRVIESGFPGAKAVSQDMFGSVSLGLGLDAKRRFG